MAERTYDLRLTSPLGEFFYDRTLRAWLFARDRAKAHGFTSPELAERLARFLREGLPAGSVTVVAR